MISSAGHTQNVRFNVDVDVRRGDRRSDDMRGIFSYDLIIDSIKIILGRGHVDLIETLASDVADEVLRHPCVVRVSVRVEKLDVVRGTVGVEIKRERARELANSSSAYTGASGRRRITKPPLSVTIVKLGGSLARTPHCAAWLDTLAAWGGPLILVPGGGPFADCVRVAQAAIGFDDAAAHRMALLAMEQFAIVLAAHARCLPWPRPARNATVPCAAAKFPSGCQRPWFLPLRTCRHAGT